MGDEKFATKDGSLKAEIGGQGSEIRKRIPLRALAKNPGALRVKDFFDIAQD